MRYYLYHHLLQANGKETLNLYHKSIGEKYENKQHYYFAFAHYLAASHYTEAARLMQVMMNFYTPERFLLLIDGTLENICPSISFSTFSMFLFRSVPIPVLQSYVPELEKALADLKTEGMSKSLLFLQHRLGLIHYYSGDVQRAKCLFADSLASSEQLDSHEFTIINLSLLAQCCRFENRLEEGISYARRALSDIEKIGTYDAHMHTVWILTELLLEQGKMDLAEPIVHELLKLAEQYHNEAARIYPLLAKAKFCRLKGELTEALNLANRALSKAEKFRISPDLGWVCLEVGLIHRNLNQVDLANIFFKRSADYFKHYQYFQELVRKFTEAPVEAPGGEKSPPISQRESVFPESNSIELISIQFLGSLKIQRGNQEIKIKRKSSLLLFIYLAANYHKKVPKDLLLEELFPESSFDSQNNRFYVSLSTLRKSPAGNHPISCSLESYFI